MDTVQLPFRVKSPFITLIVTLFCFGYAPSLRSQTNISPLADITQSGGGGGNNGPDNYNNGVISSSNSGYVSPGGWIEFEWDEPQSFDRIIFYKANRTMTTCEIQFWNGSEFVTIKNYERDYVNPPNDVVDTADFPAVTTTRLRLFNVLGISTNPNFREIEIYSFDQEPDDAAVWNLTNPSTPFQPGTEDVRVIIANNGTTPIDSVRIDWEVDGVAQPGIWYTNLLDTTYSSPDHYAEVTIGSFNFADNGEYEIKVWTSLPNNNPDNYTVNDTITTVVGPSYSGNFTIDQNAPASATNFPSFTDFAYAISEYGLHGAIEVDVVAGSGPYEEKVVISTVPGNSENNSITINGNGNTIQYNNDDAGDRAMFRLDGVRNTTIDSLNFRTLNVDRGWCLHLMNEADSNSIRNCEFDVSSVQQTGVSTGAGIVMTGNTTATTNAGNNANYTLIENNRFLGSATGGARDAITIIGDGTGASDLVVGNIVRNNEFINFTLTGVRATNTSETIIEGNTFSRPDRTFNTTTMHVIHITGSSPGLVIRNNVMHDLNTAHSGTRETRFISNLGDGTQANPTLVYNNLLYAAGGSGNQYGIYNQASWANYYHNTVVLDDSDQASHVTYAFFTTGGGNDNIEVKNNLFFMNRQTTGVQKAIRINNPISNFHSDNNAFYLGNGAGIGFLDDPYSDLESWNLETGHDVQSVVGDPGFADLANGDLFPTNAVVFVVGDDLRSIVPEDIEGRLRPENPTAGAYQFMPVEGADPAFVSLVSPVRGDCGEVDVIVEIGNFGQETVTGLTIDWSFNGVAQPSVTITNTLEEAEIIEVTLGQVTMIGWNDFDIEITSSSPTDEDLTNNQGLIEDLAAGMSGNYTIDQNASTSATNFTSFNALAEQLQGGICGAVEVEVVSGSGPYEEQVTFEFITGTSSTNTITINGNGESIEFSGISANRAAIRLNGVDHFVFDNVNIRSTGSPGWGFHLLNEADSNIIRNCEIDLSSVTNVTPGNSVGIAATSSNTSAIGSGNNANGNLIENNRIIGDGDGGPYQAINLIGESNGNSTVGNIVRNNEIVNFHLWGVRADDAPGTIIEGNEFTRPDRTGATGIMRVIYINGVSNGNIVRNNSIHHLNSSSQGTRDTRFITNEGTATQADPILIYNNIMYSADGGGVQYGIYNSSPWTNVYHNTVVLDDELSTSQATYGFYTTGAANDNIQVYNNLFYMARETSSQNNYAIRVNTASISNFESDNNVIYLSGTAGVGFFDGGFSTLSDWNQTGNDSASLVIDPFLSNIGIGNLMPQNWVIAFIGRDLSDIVDEDIESSPRTETPTPGAYEMIPQPGSDPAMVDFAGPEYGTCSGSSDVIVRVSNFGEDSVTAFTINWSINNTQQTPVNVTDTLFLGDLIEINLGSFNFQAGQTYDIVAEIVNAVPGDSDPDNNVIEINNFMPALSGSYTMNPLNPVSPTNFVSFSDLSFHLNEYGICGPVTVNIPPGTGIFEEQAVFGIIRGVSDTSQITINGNGNILTYEASGASDRPTLILDGTDHMIIDSLTIVASGASHGWGVYMTNDASYNTIRNSQILVSTSITAIANSAGIVISGTMESSPTGSLSGVRDFNGSNNTFENNFVQGGNVGIVINGHTAFAEDVIAGNRILNNTIEDFREFGIFVFAQDSCIIDGNDIYRVNRAAFAASTGIHINNHFTNGYVTNNRVHNFTGDNSGQQSIVHGIRLASSNAFTSTPDSASSLVANNLIYNLGMAGSYYALRMESSEAFRLYHNTIAEESPDSATQASASSYGIHTSGSSNNTEIKNNLVYFMRDGTGSKSAIHIGSPSSSSLIDHNAYFINENDNNAFVGTVGTTESAQTFSDWQQINNGEYDSNGVYTNPLIVNMQAGDLSPASSVIKSIGADLTNWVPLDIFGANRPPNPDPGAIEFVPSECSGISDYAVDTSFIVANEGGTAEVSWESEADLWEIEWGPCGFTPGTGQGDFVDDNVLSPEYLIENIPLNECICVYVRELCDGTPGPWSNSLELCANTEYDAFMNSILAPQDGDCGESALDVTVTITNEGTEPIDSALVELQMTGDFVRTFSMNYTGGLPPGQTETLVLGTFNAYLGGLINMTAYVDMPGDQNNSNDTLIMEDVRILSMDDLDFEVIHQSDFDYTFISSRTDANSISWDFDGQGSATGDTVHFTFAEADSFEVCMDVSSPCNDGFVCKMIYRHDLSIHNHDLKNSFAVFPNPTAGKFNLQFRTQMSDDVRLRLTDVAGNTIYNKVYTDFYGVFDEEFDFSHLAAGVYLIRLETASEGSVQHKLIIQ